MTITTKAMINIDFSEDDKATFKKAYNLVDNYGNRIREVVDTVDNDDIKVDDELIRGCYDLADRFDEAFDALSVLIDMIRSFEANHC